MCELREYSDRMFLHACGVVIPRLCNANAISNVAALDKAKVVLKLYSAALELQHAWKLYSAALER